MLKRAQASNCLGFEVQFLVGGTQRLFISSFIRFNVLIPCRLAVCITVNILLHDHFKAYYDLNCDHAECGAHILRSLKAGVDFDEVLECEKMITFLNKALSRRYELIDSGKTEMPESEYEEYRKEYIEIIDNTLTKYEAKYKDVPAKYVPDALKTLRRMKEYANEHLLFLKDFDVPFTNNAAERQARAAKAHKKISGQCYSIETSKYLTTLLVKFSRSFNGPFSTSFLFSVMT